jgi:hypothetical protein
MIDIEEEAEDVIASMFTFFMSTGAGIAQVPDDELMKLFNLLQLEIIKRNGALH